MTKNTILIAIFAILSCIISYYFCVDKNINRFTLERVKDTNRELKFCSMPDMFTCHESYIAHVTELRKTFKNCDVKTGSLKDLFFENKPEGLGIKMFVFTNFFLHRKF